MRVSVGGSLSNNVPITSGVPQGSVLGPLLFLIYVNYIGSSLTCKYMMFADDLKLFLHHPGDPSSPASAILQFNIDTLAATASSWGLKFAPGKCVHLCFRRGLGGPFNHEFPKDEEVQCKWIHLCKRDGEVNPSHARICSRHFEESAYERNIKYELLGLPVPSNQRRLNSGALPTLHMPTTSEGVASGAILEDIEERRIGKRQRLQDSDSTENADLSAEERGRTSGEHIQLSNCCHRTQLQSAYWKEQFDSACCKVSCVTKERDILVKERCVWEEDKANFIKQLDTAYCNMNSIANERDKLLKEKSVWEYERKNLEKQIEELNIKINDDTNERNNILHEKRDFETERVLYKEQIGSAYIKAMNDIKKILSKYFTPSQLDSMLHDRPVKYWQDEGICKALTLQSLSPKGYRYLREVIKLPLPCKSTLNNWVSKLNVQPGIIESVFNLLHHKAQAIEQTSVTAEAAEDHEE
ncbi:hypothetical protein Pmani_014594 [Petrolisthes manimaculis]|uniref:Uncharacterized protein n=1 Tax=Petrolisthes manimaculis TaxID=1843537 RepID=A0AAE1UCG5_9EUCA|nr:hypothetical protein Pmani_022214 [Petrolisthes manimaculis]KAK4314105.1 hypothetical protein Pmani_014594 [Petrolisthes manimaculis]